MMGLFSQAGSHIRRARGSSVEDRAPEDTEPDDTSILSVSSIPCPPSWATLVLTLTTETRMRAPSSRPSYPSSGASSLAPPRPPHQRHQGGHGSLQGHIPHFRARAPEHARAHHRLYVPPGSHIWVRPPLLALLVVVRALTPPPMRCGAMPTYASADKCPNPEERFIRVLQYYLAGWHIKPKGVKKP